MRQRQQLEQLGVVVEHLLEMRHQPLFIDRIAGKAAAEMVVDAAGAHPFQAVLDRLEKARVGGAHAGAPEHLHNRRLRKFRRPAQAAIHGVEHIADLGRRAVEFARPDDDFALRPRLVGEPRQQRGAVLLDLVGLLAEQACNFVQDVGKRRPAVARLLREIGAAPHRLGIGREKHGQRPAALLAQQVQRVHVDLVDVRPLLAVDFDADEQLVHHARRRCILERLVRHHVAPVASRVTDRQQDRPVQALGLGQRLRPPLPPVHRIVFVLEQIRRRRLRQAVFVHAIGRSRHRCRLARIARGTNCP